VESKTALGRARPNSRRRRPACTPVVVVRCVTRCWEGCGQGGWWWCKESVLRDAIWLLEEEEVGPRPARLPAAVICSLVLKHRGAPCHSFKPNNQHTTYTSTQASPLSTGARPQPANPSHFRCTISGRDNHHHTYPSDLTSTHSCCLLLTPAGRPRTLASSAAEKSSSMRTTSGPRQQPGSVLIRAALCVLLASSTAGMPYVHPLLACP